MKEQSGGIGCGFHVLLSFATAAVGSAGTFERKLGREISQDPCSHTEHYLLYYRDRDWRPAGVMLTCSDDQQAAPNLMAHDAQIAETSGVPHFDDLPLQF